MKNKNSLNTLYFILFLLGLILMLTVIEIKLFTMNIYGGLLGIAFTLMIIGYLGIELY